MIVAFVTMFLGLMGGLRTVELAVGEPVAQVEILLDGVSVGVLTQEPWTLEVDFGTELAPHRLVAVARDEAGAELGRAEQWLNLPRPLAEVEILLSSDDGGPPQSAQLIWHSASHSTPEEVAFSFDGQPVSVVDPKGIALPAYNPREMHFLRAEVRFSSTVEAVAEAVFGGAYGSTVSTEMQAVTVAIDKRRLPPATELSGWLVKGDKPLTVLATEDGPADIVLVVDLAAQQLLRELLQSNMFGSTRSEGGRRRSRTLYFDEPAQAPVAYRLTIPSGIDGGDRVRFVTPVAGQGVPSQDPYQLFPTSAPLSVYGGGIFEIMAIADMPVEAVDSQCLADAVAVAGTTAFAGNRRRCVVLVVGRDPVDRSRWSLPAVRRYLARLGVPFLVWRIVERGRRGTEAATTPDTATLGEFLDISSIKGVRDAIQEMRRELKAQRILWVDGHHLPQQISIGAAASGIRLAGVSR